MVREVVRENLEQLCGPAVRTRRKRRSPWTMALVMVLLAVAASAFALSPRWLEELPNGWTSRTAALGSPEPAAVDPYVIELPAIRPTGEPDLTAELTAELSAAEPIDLEVLPLAVRRVVIDPGHGGRSTGTQTPSGLLEKDLTLDIGKRVRRLLEAKGFEVVMTRQGDDEVDLKERAGIANEAQADIFVSIHVNWIDERGTRGVETYYLGASQDPYVNRLAAAENIDSGYSLADMRHLLDRIYTGARLGKSQQLAERVQDSLLASLRTVNPGLEDRGVKRAPFVVLVETEMPAILAEVSCLSSRREADLLTKALYRQFIAEALAHGVETYADPVGLSGEKGS